MVTTVHLITGAAIGALIKEPLLVGPISFSVHYLLDAIPHYAPQPVKGFKTGGLKGTHFRDLAIKSVEPLIGVILVTILICRATDSLVLSMVVGAFFGWLPDFFVFLEWKYNLNRPWPFRNFEIKTHRHANGIRGMLPQVVTLAVSIAVILLVYR